MGRFSFRKEVSPLSQGEYNFMKAVLLYLWCKSIAFFVTSKF